MEQLERTEKIRWAVRYVMRSSPTVRIMFFDTESRCLKEYNMLRRIGYQVQMGQVVTETTVTFHPERSHKF